MNGIGAREPHTLKGHDAGEHYSSENEPYRYDKEGQLHVHPIRKRFTGTGTSRSSAERRVTFLHEGP